MATDQGTNDVALATTAWRIGREVCIRSSGFPARRILALGNDRLAAAADAHGEGDDAGAEYAAAYQAVTERLPSIITEVARDPLFREAVIWQNPMLVGNCLDRVSPHHPRNCKGRIRELAIASYLQRYCLKNETIGFFGPVGWAVLSETGDVRIAPGENLLAKRTTYFEAWAIEQVAQAIADQAGVTRFLRPRRDPSARVVGGSLHQPGRKPIPLSPAQLHLLLRCDGRRTVGELLAGPDPDAPMLLSDLCGLGVVRIELPVSMQTWPERWLRREIECIGDTAVRTEALRPLDEIVDARDEVAAAAGEPERLQQAMAALAGTFTRITGRPASRRAGQAYAGRTLVYEDTVRDLELHLGRTVTEQLAAPLGVVLDSARWLVAEITGGYRSYFVDLLGRELRRTGANQVPLPRLLQLAAPETTWLPNEPTPIVARTLPRFQERWHKVLDTPLDPARRHAVSTADIASRVAERFPARPLDWSCATQCSPDLLIAAPSADALRRGEFLLVLGELHLATNTMESRCFVEQHPEPARLFQAAKAHHGSRRVLAVPPRGSPYVSTRVSPPSAVLLPDYTYVSGADDAIVPPESSVVLPASELVVRCDGQELVVRHTSSGAELPLFEVIGDLMTSVTATVFQPIAPAPHRPRITIDRMVLAREAWTFSIDDVPWAFVKDEASRYALARRWRIRNRLPERVFYKVPVEDKPAATDFRSLPLVNLFGKAVRRTKDAGRNSFTVTEMLPDLDQLWLSDAAGERYTCELRMVATLTEKRRALHPVPGLGDSRST